ncbi:MAG TPA: HAD hydrolase-like protein [Terriglobales bacterium]|nr:HAD hydrolase-like protein [Terriglobales bacterium]
MRRRLEKNVITRVKSSLTSLPTADAYVFDIDGTLLVARDLVHYNAMHRAMLEAYGFNATIDGIPYHGMTDLSILRATLAREGIQDGTFEVALPKALEVVCREVDANRVDIRPQVCPGIPALLEKLAARRHLMGVASGNLESVGWHKIEAARLRNYFAFGYYSDRCETRAGIFQNAVDHVKRELGASAKTCFVGDTPADVRAAREIGAHIVAVATGTFGIEELKACGPDLCIQHCEELSG